MKPRVLYMVVNSDYTPLDLKRIVVAGKPVFATDYGRQGVLFNSKADARSAIAAMEAQEGYALWGYTIVSLKLASDVKRILVEREGQKKPEGRIRRADKGSDE